MFEMATKTCLVLLRLSCERFLGAKRVNSRLKIQWRIRGENTHNDKIAVWGEPVHSLEYSTKNNRETKPKGLGWELFKNYLIAKEKFKPDLFLYENNQSASQAIKDQIKEELNVWGGMLFSKDTGVRYIEINSALVSAQNRQRFYVHNCGDVEQPKDRGIVLRDILERGEDLTSNEKSYCLTVSYNGACAWNTIERSQRTMVAEPARIPEYGLNDKSRPVTACYANKGSGEGSLLSEAFPDNPNKQVRDYVAEPIRIGDIGSTSQAHRVYSCDGKSVTLSANDGGQGGKTGLYTTPSSGNKKTIYEVKNGLITIKGKQYPIKLADDCYIIRKLTPIECERLQTLPDGYTKAVSDTQRYKGLGNGWTAEVIIHILNGALKDVPKDEEIVVLSMYDGIGTGRYCLDKMGFTNVKYYAYEIDKYAKQVSMSNYHDIIQCGDAFDVRRSDWSINN